MSHNPHLNLSIDQYDDLWKKVHSTRKDTSEITVTRKVLSTLLMDHSRLLQALDVPLYASVNHTILESD